MNSTTGALVSLREYDLPKNFLERGNIGHSLKEAKEDKMNIDDAIKIKIKWRKDNYPPPLADEMNADMLSIEALNRLRRDRAKGDIHPNDSLPGETKE